MKKWLLLLLLFPALSFGEEFSVKDLSGGLYSNPSANRVPDNAAVVLENFFTDVETLGIERNGSEKKDTTVLGGTAAVTGLWEFVDNTGQNWIISFSSKTFYKNLVGNTPTVFGQLQTVTTVPDCAVNLGKIWCVDGTDSMWWFDGTSTGTVAGAPLGTLIEPWRNRLAIANIGGAQSTVRISGDGDGTSWTIGGNATDPFAIQIGGANDGFPITGLWKSYLDNFVISRKKDLWYLSGFTQADYEIRNVSSEIGCIQQGSMREFDGSFLFLSSRGMEELRGYTIQHISEPIRNITDVIVKNTSNSRSNTQTSQSDFQAGSISPADFLSSTITAGSLMISTNVAIASFVDTSSANFNSGAFSQTTASVTVGSVQLSTFNAQVVESCFGTDSSYDQASAANEEIYRSFTSTNGVLLNAIRLRLGRTIVGGGNSTWTLTVYNDNSGSVGSSITSALQLSDFATPLTTVTVGISITPIRIAANTRYWFGIKWASATDLLRVWYPSSACNSSEFHRIGAGSNQANGLYKYELLGDQYYSTGTFTSRPFDTGMTTNTWIWNWSTFGSSVSVPSGSTITFRTQTSADGVTWTTPIDVSSGQVITSLVQRYIRYSSSFTTADKSTTPFFNDATINLTEMRRPSAFFTSQVVDSGGLATAWGPVTISDQKQGGNITYQFNASTSPNIASFNSSSWTTVASGGIPTNGVQRYIAFRSSFSATVGTATVSLDSFQSTWAEGAGAPPIVSWNYDRRYWLAYTTTTTSSPYNDRILVYQRNRTWTLLTGLNAASFATWRDFLYFGNSIGNGYVYKYDVGNADDGVSINSKIFTKSYDLGFFKNDKDFADLYANFLGNSGFSGSFSVQYDLDRSGAAYALGSANMNEKTGQVAAKFPFSLSNPVQGREIQYKIIKNGTGDRLRLYELGTVFTLLEAQ